MISSCVGLIPLALATLPLVTDGLQSTTPPLHRLPQLFDLPNLGLKLGQSDKSQEQPFTVGIHNAAGEDLWVMSDKGRLKDVKIVASKGTKGRFRRIRPSKGDRFHVKASSNVNSFSITALGSGAWMCGIKDDAVFCNVSIQRVDEETDLKNIVYELLHGESTYAGNRDVRFLNCLVPCEIACNASAASVSAAMKGLSPGWMMQRDDVGRADLFAGGADKYARYLSDVLGRAVLPHSRHPEISEASNCNAWLKDRADGGVRFAVPSQCLGWELRMLGYTCAENCLYMCSMENEAVRRKDGEKEVHYNGKWIFTRVLGVQELLSCVFSVLNGLPHLYFLLSKAPRRPPYSGQRDTPLWIAFSVVQVNTWLQSALYHGRGVHFLQVLDYHSATLALAMLLACGVAMNLPTRWQMLTSIQVALLPLLLVWVAHVSYLSFVSFDYGYNMSFAGVIGLAATAAWFLWFFRHYDQCSSFRHKVPFAVLGTVLTAPLGTKLLDFPPIGGLLDAHALWHFATIPVQFLIYDCLYAKMQHAETKEQ